METHRTSGLDRQDAWRLSRSGLLTNQEKIICKSVFSSKWNNKEVFIIIWKQYITIYQTYYRLIPIKTVEKKEHKKNLLGYALVAAYIIMFACSILQNETNKEATNQLGEKCNISTFCAGHTKGQHLKWKIWEPIQTGLTEREIDSIGLDYDE